MSKSRRILAVVLGVFVIISWAVLINTSSRNLKEYNALLTKASNYTDKKLYQKAIESYESALVIKKNKSIEKKLIKNYELGYKDGVITEKQFKDSLINACTSFPKTAYYWEKLIQLLVENKQYNDAYQYLNKALNEQVSSKTLESLKKDVCYAYSIKNSGYVSVTQNTKGYATVYDGTKWGVMKPDGDWLYECEYKFCSPITNSLELAVSTDDDIRILDEEKIVQAYLKDEISDIKGISDNIILTKDDNYRYYDCISEKYILEKYEQATVFNNDIAAVKQDESWNLIDKEGKKISKLNFSDIKIYSDSEFLIEDCFIGANKGKYGIYSSKGKLINELDGKNVDLYYGEQIAYQDKNGKWGFLDKKNKVVIKPTYEEARSFSNGMAAVKKDGKWGYINKENEVVIDYQFEDAGYFTKEGTAFVSYAENEYFLLTLRFKEVL